MSDSRVSELMREMSQKTKEAKSSVTRGVKCYFQEIPAHVEIFSYVLSMCVENKKRWRILSGQESNDRVCVLRDDMRKCL